MAESLVKIGHLIRLNDDLTVDHSVPSLPIFQGANFIGRSSLSLTDKRVSRKHISLQTSNDGSVEVTVEGPNPIIHRSGGQRKRLSSQEKIRVVHGDIIELIPSEYLFMYEVGDEHTLSSETNSRFSRTEKRHGNEVVLSSKRSRQVEVKTIARSQEIDEVEKNDLNTTLAAKFDESTLHQNNETIRHFKVENKSLPSVFRLMQVQGLPTWANTSSVTIGDVIQGNVHVALLSNYMVDMDWLMSACPGLWKIPHVLVVHGESSGMMDHYKKTRLPNWVLHKPPLPISYGTHHTKAMLLVYDKGVRVVVHTANLIYVDWNNKTQGLWMQDFPWKDQNNLNDDSLFEHDLVDYLTALKWPEFSVKLPVVGNVNINASFFKKFDYSSAKVRLIASVPGYHTGPSLRKWGHMKLRSILENCIFDKEFHKSPLVYQFSSLGSLDEKWLSEFAVSMSSGVTNDRSPLGTGKPQIIWPTVEDVRCSIEGYAAGNAIPSPQKNVEKDFLKKYWARWKANHVGRCRAMPHVKTYTRYNGQNLAWFLLTSANLSKAAWGALQKNNSQLMIRSYELGVLFLPSNTKSDDCPFSCTGNHDSKQTSKATGRKETRLATLCRDGNATADTSEVIQLPVPYQLPPQPYSSEDIPWSWDRRYTKKDVYGEVWPRHVQLYQNQGD